MNTMVATSSRLWRRATALAVAAVLSTGALMMSTAGSAGADERDDLADQLSNAEHRTGAIEEELAGLSEDLKKIYTQLADVRAQLPSARSEVTAAQASVAAAQRQYDQVSERLDVTKAELTRLGDEISRSEGEFDQAQTQMANLAREVYRSGQTTSPLLTALTARSTADIAQRAASAQALAHTQAQAIEGARHAIAESKNRSARQQALTDQVGKLQEQAATARANAQSAQASAQEKLDALAALESQEAASAQRAEANKAQAQQELSNVQAQAQQLRSRIAAIDEENRRKQVDYNGGGSPVSTSGIWGYPLPREYPVTSPFGWRWHPIYGQQILHSGVDLGAPCGTSALATANGVVTQVAYNPWGGNYVTLNYGVVGGNSYQAMYLHLSAQTVYVGQQVTKGQQVGITGTTGSSTGCHLHYEFIINGTEVDPLDYM